MAAPRSPLTPRVAAAAALGLAAAGLIAFALSGEGEGVEEAAAVPVAPTVAPTVAPAAPTVAATALPKPPAPARPFLDLVRVEPDGAAMLAGRAAPGDEVTIRAGGTVLATAGADASGAFVATFDAAPDGPRDLTVSAGGAGAPELALTLPEPEGGFVPAAGEVPAEPAPTLAAGPALAPEAIAESAPESAPKSAPEPAAEPAPPVAAPPVEVAAVTPVAVPAAGSAPAPEPAPPSRTAATDPAAAAPQSAPLPRPTARPAGAGAATAVVQPGGTLWRLAREHYGAGRRYPAIVSANADKIADPALIFPGQRLVLPPAGRSD